MITKKKIILGTQQDFYLAKYIKENLTACGFEIVDATFPTRTFKYKNIFDKAHNFIRKTFLNDRNFKQKLRLQDYEAKLIQTLNELKEKADFALIIRPDIYPEHFLQLIKTKAKLFCAYQWDGLERYAHSKQVIAYFDKFFVFDPTDFFKYKDKYSNLFFSTNFYFDIPELLNNDENIQIKNQIFYLGTYEKHRLETLENILSKLNNFQQKIIIHTEKKTELKQNVGSIQITASHLSYEENIKLVKGSSVLIDIPVKAHAGLTFRTFEAVCFEKKLITSNDFIRGYDFYKKENIFILGKDDESYLESFVAAPYIKIDEAVKRKYSFTNWINYMLNIEPYSPIEAPVMG